MNVWIPSDSVRGTEIGPYWLSRTSGLARHTISSSAPAPPREFWVGGLRSLLQRVLSCLDSEGPIAQTGAPYAKVPGIRVYGMLCRVNGKKRRRKARVLIDDQDTFPRVPDYMLEMVN